jgi:hypothetical protein
MANLGDYTLVPTTVRNEPDSMDREWTDIFMRRLPCRRRGGRKVLIPPLGTRINAQRITQQIRGIQLLSHSQSSVCGAIIVMSTFHPL